jgi:hypothetical protein
MNGWAAMMGTGRLSRQARAWPVRLALAFVVGLIFAIAWSEEAHAVSNTDTFRFSSDLCIKEKSSTYVWSQDGALYGQSVTRPFSGDCSSRLSAPPGYVSGRAIVWKWSNLYGDWFVCRHGLALRRRLDLEASGLQVVGLPVQQMVRFRLVRHRGARVRLAQRGLEDDPSGLVRERLLLLGSKESQPSSRSVNLR